MKTEKQEFEEMINLKLTVIIILIILLGIILTIGCAKEPETHCYECENQYFVYNVCDVTQQWIDEQCDRMNNDNCRESYLKCKIQ